MSEARLGGVRVDEDVPIPRSDGVTLHADVYRPSTPGRHPVLLLRNAYDKRVAQSYWYAPPSWYAERGYVVVMEDVRGRFRSEGRFVPLDHEAADGVDLAEWAAGQPWSNGRIGTYGYSYCGLIQLLAAAAGAPVEAVAPALSPKGLGEGCLHQDGVAALAFTVTWAVELGVMAIESPVTGHQLTRLSRDVIDQLLRVRPISRLLERAEPDAVPWLRHWFDGDPGDPYWHQDTHHPRYDAITAPALHLAGAYDTFRSAAVEHYRALAGRRDGRDLLRLGPWTHQPNRSAGPDGPLAPSSASSRWDVNDLQLRFYERTLRDSGTEDDAAMAAILNSDAIWHGDCWPPGESEQLELHLDSNGRAATDGGTLENAPARRRVPDHLVYSHADPVPALGGDDCCDSAVLGMGPADQRSIEIRRDVLVYTAAPWPVDVLVVGDASAEIFVEAVEPTSQWLARLCLVTRSGASVNVCEGVTRLGSPTGFFRVEFGPLALRVGAGERLRLHVTCGSYPRWMEAQDAQGTPQVTRAVVRHDPGHPSRLVLPVLP